MAQLVNWVPLKGRLHLVVLGSNHGHSVIQEPWIARIQNFLRRLSSERHQLLGAVTSVLRHQRALSCELLVLIVVVLYS
ncbi:hypothetical protein V6N13_026431 [Hibiscus sabdariffa]